MDPPSMRKMTNLLDLQRVEEGLEGRASGRGRRGGGARPWLSILLAARARPSPVATHPRRATTSQPLTTITGRGR
jgi:hypothetical protein